MSEATANEAATPLNSTRWVLVKLIPVTEIVVPTGASAGEKLEILGATTK